MTAPNDFTQKFHSYGGGAIFLIGVLLFTVGSLGGIIISFSIASIISLALLSLPIIGFWLIFFSSRSASGPGKSLAAITLFKISVIIGLVVVSLIGALLLIGLVLVIGFAGTDFLVAVFAEIPGITMIFFGTIFAIILFVILYYKSVLTVLSGLRDGLTGKRQGKVRNVGLLTFLMSLIVGFSMLTSVITLAFVGMAAQITSTAQDFISYLAGDFSDMLEFLGIEPLGFVADFMQAVMLAAIFSLAENVGIIFCLIALCAFNSSLASAPMYGTAYSGQPQMQGNNPTPYGSPPMPGFAPPPAPYPQTPAAPTQSQIGVTCSSCGFSLASDDVFCENCGQRQAPAAQAPTTSHQVVTPPIAPHPASAPAAMQPQVQPVMNTPRMSLIFLLDTSFHAKPYISSLNYAINNFKSEVIKDPHTERLLDTSVIAYNDEIAEKLKLASVSRMRPMRLIAGGESKFTPPILEALNMLPPSGFSLSYTPWVVLISAANPTDDTSHVASSLKSMQNAGNIKFITLSVGGNNINSLKYLTDIVYKQDSTDFAAFFDWVKKSMWAISKTSPGGSPSLPQMEGNVTME